MYDYRQFDRATLRQMQEVAYANINGVMPEERLFWLGRLNAIEAAIRSNYDKLTDLLREVSGAARSAPEQPNPDVTVRQLQAGVAGVDPPTGALRRDDVTQEQHRKASEGAAQLKRLWGSPHKDPVKG